MTSFKKNQQANLYNLTFKISQNQLGGTIQFTKPQTILSPTNQ